MGLRRVDLVGKQVEARQVTDVLLVAAVDGFVTALNCTDGGGYNVMWVKRIGSTPLVKLAGAVTEASPGRRGSPRASTERFLPGADGSVFLAQANAGDRDGDAADAPRPTFTRLPYLPHDVARSGEPARILQGAVFRSDFITSTTTLDLATGAVLSSTASDAHLGASAPFAAAGPAPVRAGPSVLFSRVDKTVHVSGSHSSADNWNLTLASIELPGIIPSAFAPLRRPGREPSGFLDAPDGSPRGPQPKELQLFATLQGELMGRFGDSGPANFSRHFHAPIHSVYRVRDASPGLGSDPPRLQVEKVPFSLEWPQATKLSLERQSQGEGTAFIATLEDGSSIAYPDRFWSAGMSQLAIAAALAGEDSLDASGSGSDAEGSLLRVVDSPTGHSVASRDLCDSEESKRLWDADGQRDRALCRRVTATSQTQLGTPPLEPVAAPFSAAEAFLRPGLDVRGPEARGGARGDPSGSEAALPHGFVLYQVQALNRPWMEALRARLPEPVMTTDAAGVLFISSSSALASVASHSWPVPRGGVSHGALSSMDPYLDAGLSELSRTMGALPVAGGRLAIEAPPMGPLAPGGPPAPGNGSLRPPFGEGGASRRGPSLDSDAVSIQLGRFASLDGGAAILFLMGMLLLGATVLAFLASRLRGSPAQSPGDLASPALSPAPSGGEFALSPMSSQPTHAGLAEDPRSGRGLGPPATRVVDGQEYEEVTPDLLVSKKCLGKGSQGTYVFDGMFKGRPVAVKRMVQESFEARAQNEVKLLIGSNHLPNVVQYYDCVTRSSFIYLVLERCDLSLGSAVMKTFRARKARAAQLEKVRLASRTGGSAVRRSHRASLAAVPLVSPATRAFLRQIVDGLAQLHGAKIVHRDVKPHNILLIHRAVPTPRPSRRFDRDSSSLSGAAASGQSPPLTPQTSRRRGSHLSPAASAESFVARDPYASECADFGDWVPKISDMGLGKLLADGASSFGDVSTRLHRGRAALASAHGDEDSSSSFELAVGAAGRASSGPGVPGTEGWQAPEAVESNRRLLETMHAHHPTTTLSAYAAAGAAGSDDAAAADALAEGPRHTRSMDVWSLGCVLYFVIDAGNHPFGYGLDQKELIVQGQPDLSRIATSMPEACDLLQSMLARDPERRPHALEVLSHPFFWSDTDRIGFFRELSDRLQLESDDSAVFRALKVLSPDVFGHEGWCSKLPGAFVDGGDPSARQYDPQSLRDCFRLVRNRASHFLELPASVRKLVPGTDASALVPFLANKVRLPGLFLAGVHVAMAFFADEPAFARFGLKAWADTPPGRASVAALLSRIGTYAPVMDAEAGAGWTVAGHKPAPPGSEQSEASAPTGTRSEAATAHSASGGTASTAGAAPLAADPAGEAVATPAATGSGAAPAVAASAPVPALAGPTPLALRMEALAAQHRAVDREAGSAGVMPPGPWLRACAQSAERAEASVRTVKTKSGSRKHVVCAHTFPRATTYGGGANTSNVAYKLKRCRDWDVAEGRCSRGERCDFLHSPLEACLHVAATNPMANWLQPPTGFKLGGSGKRSKRKAKHTPAGAAVGAGAGASAPV
ncbi:hypothetical protein FNF28_03919 [Cafeteria roenbergensis]|uniref:non-specific serine/threonine protein kinase n=1 Tax=Cafeteria roenbergensis TaxID=33653 RepID=A0A5A8DG73_CAFRO|nr:hypothetical protein FNF28_03919 [Cafeteria roenbergensis]